VAPVFEEGKFYYRVQGPYNKKSWYKVIRRAPKQLAFVRWYGKGHVGRLEKKKIRADDYDDGGEYVKFDYMGSYGNPGALFARQTGDPEETAAAPVVAPAGMAFTNATKVGARAASTQLSSLRF
jgi:hypothetical protein